MESLILKTQEIPFDHPDSRYMFDSQFFATTAALKEFGAETIGFCLDVLQKLAREQNGLDYLQVITLPKGTLWIMDSDSYVTALLPSDY